MFIQIKISALQSTTEKHRMSFPETVDEILDVSEDEGKIQLFNMFYCESKFYLN